MSGIESRIVKADSSLVDRWLAYAVFRFTLGINILIHGGGRLFGPGAREFAAKTSGEFVGTPLSHSLVYAFLLGQPFAEAILGALLVIGLFTRWTLTLGGLLIAALVFGTGLRSDWPTVDVQMVYAIIYYFLLRNLADNHFSFDGLLARHRKSLAFQSTAPQVAGAPLISEFRRGHPMLRSCNANCQFANAAPYGGEFERVEWDAIVQVCDLGCSNSQPLSEE